MKAARVEGQVTEDGQLLVDLPPDLTRGRVVVTVEPVADDELDLRDEDVQGAGLTAVEIAASPDIGAWADEGDARSGAEFVELLRRAAPRHSW